MAIPLIDPVLLKQAFAKTFEVYGDKIISRARDEIIGHQQADWPPLAESTIRKKGHDMPLIDKEEMKKSFDKELVVGVRKIKLTVGNHDHAAPIQENGTTNGHVPARPFLKPAIEHLANEIMASLHRDSFESITWTSE